MTSQQEQQLRLQAKVRGYDAATTERFIQFAKQKTQALEPAAKSEPQKQSGDGFLKSLAKSVANPFLRLGATAQAFGTSKLLGGPGADTAPKNVPFFGPQKPITTAKDALGVGAELASFAVGGGGAAQAGKQALKGVIKNAALKGVKTGASSGALYSGGQSLQQDKGLAGVALDTAKGAAIGGLTGGALSGTAALATKGIQKAGETVNKTLGKSNPLSTGSRIITNRTKELERLENSNSKLRKLSANSTHKGIDVKKMLAETDLLHNSVDDSGTIRTQNAIADLNDFIKPQENVISQNLVKEGKRIPLGMVESHLKQVVNTSGLKGGAKIRALKNVADDIKGYALDADKDGYISVAILHDAKVDKYANINYLNPESKRADKSIAKGLKELVEKHTSSVDVKKLNEELAQWYSLQNYLEALDGKKVDGGKLGKYFAQTIGAVAGSHFGPFGTVIGAEAAGRLRGVMMKSKFSSKIGSELKNSSTMQRAIQSGKDTVINLP